MIKDRLKITRYLLTGLNSQRQHRINLIFGCVRKSLCLSLLIANLPVNYAYASEILESSNKNFNNSSNSIGEAALPADTSLILKSNLSHPVKRADFKLETASHDARKIADWIVDSGNNRFSPFIIIDKVEAKAFVFDADGHLVGAAPVLLGSAKGDDSIPGIGNLKLANIRPENRTTPAGRFMSTLERGIHGKEILWIDYDAAISLHRVVTSNAKERRAKRLATPTPSDNRISYGCINVPVQFYQNVVSAVFRQNNGIVYILPETRSAMETFGAYDVDERARLRVLLVS